MDDNIIENRTIKAAEPSADPLVKKLFDIMDEQGVSPKELEARAFGTVKEDTIIQWRFRSTPTITNLRLCFEALGYELVALGPEETENVPTLPPGAAKRT